MKTMFDAVDQMEGALTFHRERHGVLAGNLANLDTPGYRPLDLGRPEPLATENGGVAMASTDPHHLAPGAAATGGSATFEDAQNAGADGNAVNLEREMAKVAANRVRYATTTELVSRRLALMRYCATDGSG